MISAQVDQVVQEILIEKYMMLPNQVWDDIISQASKVRMCLELNILLHQHMVEIFYMSGHGFKYMWNWCTYPLSALFLTNFTAA